MDCTCGHAHEEHEIRHGSAVECLIAGCDCICFEWGSDEDVGLLAEAPTNARTSTPSQEAE